MMYLIVSRSWLFSRRAQRLYLVCAILDLVLLGGRMGIAAAMVTASASVVPPSVSLVAAILLLPAVVGSAILLVGMSYCWLGIGGSYKKKLLWILLLRLFLVAMPIYYFFFYRPMVAREKQEMASALPS